MVGWDGSTESSAASQFTKGTGDTIEIATSTTSLTGDYTLAVKATVDTSTTATHYMAFTAKLFTYTAQANDYQVYTIGSTAQTYTILPPILVSSSTFTPTCQLYDSLDGTTLATTAHSTWLTGFDTSTGTITVSTSTTGLSGEYNLQYKCTLDDDDASIEWTTINYYILEATAVSQTEINYLINQDVIS